MILPDRHTPRRVIGWDLGGVHVKAALVVEGRVRDVVQVPCPLWSGLPALDEALAALPDWTRAEADHAVTMTGELTDCFADRGDGVAQLAHWAAACLRGRVQIYGGRAGFVAPDAAAASASDVASANWHATAALAARRWPDALLVDIGSTTADLVPIVGGRPAPRGYTDAERLVTGELVYTGVVRTAVATLAAHAPWRGRRTTLMAEHFATAGDLYRLTGDLAADADQQRTPDDRGKSVAESETRLARMIGRDRAEGEPAEWRALAAWFAEAQARTLHDAAAVLLSRTDVPGDAPVIVCGAGRFLAGRVAARCGRRAVPLTDAVPGERSAETDRWVSTCGPAVAVALLA